MASAAGGQLLRLRGPLENGAHLEKHVVRAIIASRDGRVLVVEKVYPEQSFFELVGGKVDHKPGKGRRAPPRWIEDPQTALRREIGEEIGEENIGKILRVRYRASVDYRSSEGLPSRQSFFDVDMAMPLRITLSEHASFMWLPHDDMLGIEVKEKSAIGIADFWKDLRVLARA